MSCVHEGFSRQLLHFGIGGSCHLSTQDASFRAIVDSTLSFAIIATDRDGLITHWNSGAEHVLGWPSAAMVGGSIAGIFTPEDRAAGCLEQDLAQAKQAGRANGQRWYLRGDGSRFWASGELTPLRAEQGDHIGFVMVLRDATGEEDARRELAMRREHLSQMFEQAPTFMAILNGPEHRFERVNPGYRKLIGHREVLGMTVAEALPDAVEQGFLNILDEVYRTGVPFQADGYRYAVQTEPGGPVDERFVNFVYQPLRDGDGAVTGIFVEGADVTDRTVVANTMRENEQRYRTLFDAIDEGFCIIEFFDGPHGPLSDYIHVEANAAYARHAGIPNVVGRSCARWSAKRPIPGWRAMAACSGPASPSASSRS